MIKRIEFTRFKKYKKQSFDINPNGITLLVGGNNSGKSTLIQGLSIWEFCKMVLEHEKGRSVFNKDEVGSGEGFGMSAEEFLPIAVPSLNHLWTNLKTQLSPIEKAKKTDKFTGYILRIKCIWDSVCKKDNMLEIGLSLVNDRLFIRVTDSNLNADDLIPTVVYLPTFAGVLPKETKATIAERRAHLGRGMAGSILRNIIYDLYLQNQTIKKELIGEKAKLSSKDREELERMSPLNRLNNNLRNTFSTELEVVPFNEDFHTIIRVYERKGLINENGIFEAFPKSKYTPRDIISQGSGFLQWLSIFCILYGQQIDVLLLDEPDAHLHASLQNELLQEITNFVQKSKIQILLSTHSVEIIKSAQLNNIYSMDSRKYLAEEASRVTVLAGIGNEYFPRIDLLKRYKKVMFIENESDKCILSILGEKCGIKLPEDIVFWPTTDTHSTRKHLFDELQKIIPELRGISLRDRDMEEPDTIGEGLVYKSINLPKNYPLKLLQWRRKNIESYLLCPKAIAAASGNSIEAVISFFKDNHALSMTNDGYIEAFPPNAVVLCDGKKIFTLPDIGLESKYHCSKYDVAKHMTIEGICEDIKTFLTQVKSHFSGS